MTGRELDGEVSKRLSDHQVRYTSGRRVVVAALARSEGPKSPAELHAKIGSVVPLSSLYRSLAVLESAGIVVPHFGAKGVTRYELAEWLRGHHHHLICIVCGSVEDIAISQPHEAKLAELVKDIGAAASFASVNHVLEIEGRCAKCA